VLEISGQQGIMAVPLPITAAAVTLTVTGPQELSLAMVGSVETPQDDHAKAQPALTGR
jgi:beta-fructofuranosidase